MYMKELYLSILLSLICVGMILASSHREAPLISNDPLADNVDVYAFRSPDNENTITLIATYVPLQLAHGGPNYYSFGENIRYEIHVDNEAGIPGDEVTYRFTFNIENEDPTTFFYIRAGARNQKLTYTLERSMNGGMTFETIIQNGIVPPNNIGPRSIQSIVGLNTTYESLWNNAIMQASTGETVFAGPSDDPFFVDLGGIFDLGDAPRQNGTPADGLACYNVSALAIQVPIATLLKKSAPSSPTSVLDPDYVIGVWASASRPAIKTLSTDNDPAYSGDWVQVSRLGMPLTNEAVIAIGDKDYWNSLSPYDEISDTTLDGYFFNPELALYMDDDQFGGAVPAFAPLRIQENSLGAFDFTNGADGLFGLKGNPALEGTALAEDVFGSLLLPGPGMPRSVDLWPAFHTGVPNMRPYQLATGKGGDPLAAGKPFIHNFLPNGGDMLRLNMSTPATSRTLDQFSSLGLIQAAVLGLTAEPYINSTDVEFIPNMDGFPNGRRLEDDVTRIELQAVSGVVLAAVGLWYDDYDPMNSASPVTQNLLNVIGYTTGVEQNDKPFGSSFPYLAMPSSGTGECSGQLYQQVEVADPVDMDGDYKLFVSSNTQNQIGVFGLDAGNPFISFTSQGMDADGIYYDGANDVVYQLNRSDNVINAYSNVTASLNAGGSPSLTATSSSDFVNGREIAVSNGRLVVAQDADGTNGDVNKFVVYTISPTSIEFLSAFTTTINLWGIHLEGNTLYAIEDNTNNLAVFEDFFSNTDGSTVVPDRSIGVAGIVRTHGITYAADEDLMILTDVGSGAVADDGAFAVISGFADAIADDSISIDEQIRIEGPSSLLGNPVDVGYNPFTNDIYIAERANSGGRILIFDYPGISGDLSPTYSDVYPGASAIHVGECVAPINPDGDFKLFASSNNQPLVGVLGLEVGNPLATFASAAGDADGIYYDGFNDVVYQLNRTDNVINAYSDVVVSLNNGNTPLITATSSSDFTNGREIAVYNGKLVVAQDADPTNGNVNKFVIYNVSPTKITYMMEFVSPINLWGIHLEGNNLFAIEDNSSNLAVFENFFSNTDGSTVMPTRSITIEDMVRTHGITYDAASDVMILTDVGSGAVADDGAFIVVENFISVSDDNIIGSTEQIRIAGPNSFLGNPVDIAYSPETSDIFVAERANGGGRILIFEYPGASGDVSPAFNIMFAGASAINLGECVNTSGVVYFGLDECDGLSGSTSLDFSEFTAEYPESLECATFDAPNGLYRTNPASNPHSCTRGVNGTIGMCVSARDACTYDESSNASVKFDVVISPEDGQAVSVDGLSFFESAPITFEWIGGMKGVNNYPTLYTLRILKDGEEVFRSEDNPTTRDYTLESFDLRNITELKLATTTTITIELQAYCLIGRTGFEPVAAWDLDDISLQASCTDAENLTSDIMGIVFTDEGENLEGVIVTNSSDQPERYPRNSITSEVGLYEFPVNPNGEDYILTGNKEDDPLNGVSTLDIIVGLRHILGIEPITSPYKLIAADVNADGKVSAVDFIELRKVLLGIEDGFSNNEVWSFVNNTEALTMENVWEYQESILIKNLSRDMINENFVGVKTGDLDGNAIANTRQTIIPRSNDFVTLLFTDKILRKDEVTEINFYAENFKDLSGFQFTMNHKGIEIVGAVPRAINLDERNIGRMDEGTTVFSWNDFNGVDINSDEILFTLIVRSDEDLKIGSSLILDDDRLPAESYFGASNIITGRVSLSLREAVMEESGLIVEQNKPNPFIDDTYVDFYLPEDGKISFTLFNNQGKVLEYKTSTFARGRNSIKINKAEFGLVSGIYYYRIQNKDQSIAKKLIVL